MDLASLTNCLAPSATVSLPKPTCSLTRRRTVWISPAPPGGGAGGGHAALDAQDDAGILVVHIEVDQLDGRLGLLGPCVDAQHLRRLQVLAGLGAGPAARIHGHPELALVGGL